MLKCMCSGVKITVGLKSADPLHPPRTAENRTCENVACHSDGRQLSKRDVLGSFFFFFGIRHEIKPSLSESATGYPKVDDSKWCALLKSACLTDFTASERI